MIDTCLIIQTYKILSKARSSPVSRFDAGLKKLSHYNQRSVRPGCVVCTTVWRWRASNVPMSMNRVPLRLIRGLVRVARGPARSHIGTSQRYSQRSGATANNMLWRLGVADTKCGIHP
jgi:hypothetical protein